MKNILLLVHHDAGQEARMGAALDLARATGGQIACIDVTVPPHRLADFVSDAAGQMLLHDARETERQNRELLQRRLTQERVAWRWVDYVGDPFDALARQARLADIIVLSTARVDDAADIRNLVGRVLRKTRRPVLAMPPTCKGLDLHATALIAWDGSPEADNALAIARPLLRQAGAVVLLDVNEGGTRTASLAADYLLAHRIRARIETPSGIAADAVGPLLLARAGALEAGYVVMGAYHNPPIAQRLLGGVSQFMLENSAVPLLLAH